jgi:hypothetical protein
VHANIYDPRAAESGAWSFPRLLVTLLSLRKDEEHRGSAATAISAPRRDFLRLNHQPYQFCRRRAVGTPQVDSRPQSASSGTPPPGCLFLGRPSCEARDRGPNPRFLTSPFIARGILLLSTWHASVDVQSLEQNKQVAQPALPGWESVEFWIKDCG